MMLTECVNIAKQPSGKKTNHMKPVTIYRTFSPVDAQLIRSRLEASDLDATVTHELSALSMEGYSLSTGGIRVQVPEDQVDAAREIIELPAATENDE